MEVPITQFRREIFALANRVLDGETITIAYKGKRLRVAPEVDPVTRFDRLTSLKVLDSALPDAEEDAAMKSEMQAEWEKDWEEQGLV
jgi:antitoxin (DNA-binding transcriptional repressor) of toxin-antitoxin stability system